MAVESRFVVIRQGVEVETFMDKKSADEYDKMLDMADSLAEMLSHAPVELTEQATEELSIYFAKHREDVLIALQAKKAKPEQAKAKPEPVKAEPALKAVDKAGSKKADSKDAAKGEKKPAKATKSTKAGKAAKEASLSEAS
ncbi:YebG family protein [Thalassomonas viridans]|uniref:YebG family protein n=1 Tax=Thalassomonas viridans TaxID=137584 RepID=A0AAF0CAY7_9GAMM|nr:YebG family protein [Thalassomonas viridans]WDE06224.1 YebG family protein [Thalassomonas viridans]